MASVKSIVSALDRDTYMKLGVEAGFTAKYDTYTFHIAPLSPANIDPTNCSATQPPVLILDSLKTRVLSIALSSSVTSLVMQQVF